jgi:hypothetical protein
MFVVVLCNIDKSRNLYVHQLMNEQNVVQILLSHKKEQCTNICYMDNARDIMLSERSKSQHNIVSIHINEISLIAKYRKTKSRLVVV